MRSTLAILLFAAGTLHGSESTLRITERFFHLGNSSKPEWRDRTSVEPTHRTEVEIDFQSRKNEKRLYLEVRAGNVEGDWKVKLNGHELGTLEKGDDLITSFFRVPSSTLKDGNNRLLIIADRGGDDIYVGKAALHDRPIGELKGHARLSVAVRDGDTGAGVPCRLTVARLVEKKEKETDRATGRERDKLVMREELLEVSLPDGDDDVDLAVRKGIIYTLKGAAVIDVPPGPCILYASRGFEYSVSETHLLLQKREERVLDLEIRREVDTTGFLAADTHIHTKTHSGHGDINVEERVVAIAGEGVEVAVATDHNHHTDYRPAMEKVGIRGEFTPVIGNEVTTAIGHFNAFPVERKADPPEHDHTQWAKLIQAMRGTPGVRVVILNHPRRALSRISPLDRIGFNPVSGEAHYGPADLGLDAIEILNGKTLEDDPMVTVKDWFGLLNRGFRVAAVAGSDSHSVDDVVGQARTYVKSSTDDPRRIQIEEVCDNFLAGHLLVSLGLLARVEVDGKHEAGDFATGIGKELAVKITVAGPSWTRADSVAIYLNGLEARREKIPETEAPVKYADTWRIPAPSYDAHLVLVASGPPVKRPHWPLDDDKKYVLGVANAVWIDGDGDGKFTSAFEYASRIVKEHGLRGESLLALLAKHDAAVAAEFASLARAAVQGEAQEAYEKILAEADRKLAEITTLADPAARKGAADYVMAAPKLDIRTREDREWEAARLKREEEDRKKRREEAARKRREKEEEEAKQRQAGSRERRVR